MKIVRLLVLLCWLPVTASWAKDDSVIHVTLLHFNDIYEIMPINNGREGGLARVATLRKQLLQSNPNTITLLGGDLFNPSAMGMAPVNGRPLAGQQMVDVLNQLGLDYATFGNHEFDLQEDDFFQRMKEVRFNWVSSNVFDAQGKLFPRQTQHLVLPIRDQASGKTFTIGIFGLTLSSNRPHYVTYSDPMAAAAEQIAILDAKSDFVLALTHQSIEDDETLLQRQTQIDLLLGGHEHENYQRWRGQHQVPLLKADGNVRSVYVVDLYFNPRTRQTHVVPRFVPINESIPEDAAIKQVVERWKKKAFDAFRRQGFDPEAVIGQTAESLDGLSSHVRTGQTNLTRLIADSILQSYGDGADLSLYNSGSIRIDDTLPAGQISVYDVIRILPFGGEIRLVEMKGALLQKVLQQGEANVGSGGFLQSANTGKDSDGRWLVGGKAIVAEQRYKVAIADFLLSGKEANLSYLTTDNPELRVLEQAPGRDLRKLLIARLGAKK